MLFRSHSSFTVSNVSRTRSRGVSKPTSTSDWQTGGNDNTCLVDRTWGSVTVTRCATYVRSVDAMIIVDYVKADRLAGKKKQLKRAATRSLTQRWQLPPGIAGIEYLNDVMTLGNGDARLDVHKSGPGTWDITTAKSGSSAGWFTAGWGEKVPGAVMSRSVPLSPKADSQVLVTVLVPRTSAEAVRSEEHTSELQSH